MKLKKNKKAKCQKRHAVKRALQRYDLDLNSGDYNEVVRMIQEGEAQFVEKQSNRVSIFQLTYKEKSVKVVYDKLRKTIVSFLPLTSAPDYRG